MRGKVVLTMASKYHGWSPECLFQVRLAELCCKFVFLMNSEAMSEAWILVNFKEYIGFPHDLKVVFTNHLYFYSSLTLTMK